MRKSVKMQWIENGATLMKTEGDRFHKVYMGWVTEDNGVAVYFPVYVYRAGTVGLGTDWYKEYETLEELRAEMGDLRKWKQVGW